MAIEKLVASTPVVIADGHHRYETATFYREEQHEAHADTPGDYDAVMALVVELSPDELFVQAIHRLVSGLPDGTDVLGLFEAFFEVTKGPSAAASRPEPRCERLPRPRDAQRQLLLEAQGDHL